MTLWFVIALMTIMAAAALLLPLARRRTGASTRATFDLTVYKDQLAEIARDQDRGVISPEEAAAARLEVERRMLALDPNEIGKSVPPTSISRRARYTLLAIALAGPAAALAVYLDRGSPGLPDAPFVANSQEPGVEDATGKERARIDAMVERLATSMKKNPDDLQGWLLLARSYMTLKNYEGAAAAYAEAARLDPKDANYPAGRGEALVLASDGMVTPAAEDEFHKALTIDPKEARSRFYLGLARLQAGEPAKALSDWKTLASEAPADAPWLPMLQQQIARLNEFLAREPGKTDQSPGGAPPGRETPDRENPEDQAPTQK